MDNRAQHIPPEDPSRTGVRGPAPAGDGEVTRDYRPRKQTLRVSRQSLLGSIPLRLLARLEVTTPIPGAPERFALDAEPVDIGRIPECRLCLPINSVSRRHARVSFLNDEYCIEDLQSTNGTFVNGVQVSRCVLRHNDMIEIGEAKVLYVEERVRQ